MPLPDSKPVKRIFLLNYNTTCTFMNQTEQDHGVVDMYPELSLSDKVHMHINKGPRRAKTYQQLLRESYKLLNTTILIIYSYSATHIIIL